MTTAATRLDLGGPTLLLHGRAVIEVAWLVKLGLQSLRQRDGMAAWPELLELHRMLEAAAGEQRQRMSGAGHPDVRREAAPASSASTRWIGTREVAQMLGITQRHAQRLGPELGVRRGVAYRFDADQIAAYAARQEADAA